MYEYILQLRTVFVLVCMHVCVCRGRNGMEEAHSVLSAVDSGTNSILPCWLASNTWVGEGEREGKEKGKKREEGRKEASCC